MDGPIKNDDERELSVRRYRITIAILITLSVLAYIIGIIAGFVPADRRVDTVSLVLVAVSILAVVLLLRPEALSRLKLLKMSGFELQLLEEVKEQQIKQGSQLEDIALILPLLLPETERKHLINLADRTTSGYKGNSSLRSELRRLRSIGLIKMFPHHHIGDLKDGLSFDLAEQIELTNLGQRWVKRIKELEKVEF